MGLNPGNIDMVPLANLIIERYAGVLPNLTPMKVQKLLYYLWAWNLVVGNEEVEGTFYAWQFGPVNPSVYHNLRKFGRGIVSTESGAEVAQLSERSQMLVDLIAWTYGQKSALELSMMTHKEDPWRETPANGLIEASRVVEYYGNLPYADFVRSFDPSKPFMDVYSSNDAAFTLDMDLDLVEKLQWYPDFESYKLSLKKAKQIAANVWEKWQSNDGV